MIEANDCNSVEEFITKYYKDLAIGEDNHKNFFKRLVEHMKSQINSGGFCYLQKHYTTNKKIMIFKG